MTDGRQGTTLVLVAGFAGSGKTECGKILAAETGWALIDKDTITRPLVEELLVTLNGDPNDRHTPLYRDQVRPLEYRCLLAAGFENLDCGVSTILAAPLIAQVSDTAWMGRLGLQCRARGVRLEVIWVSCDPEAMRDRLRSRNAGRDTWKLACWAEYLESIDLELRPCVDHRVIDNGLGASVSLLDQVKDVADSLDHS